MIMKSTTEIFLISHQFCEDTSVMQILTTNKMFLRLPNTNILGFILDTYQI